jgi:hypothetical protein
MKLKWVAAAVCGVVLAGVLAAVGVDALGSRPTAAETPNSVPAKRGNYERYLYAITDISGQNKKMAQFDPSLPTDEGVVLGMLKELAKAGYALEVPETAQPVVETRDEVNYVTFSAGAHKVFFELFRNSHGEVGSVKLWQE